MVDLLEPLLEKEEAMSNNFLPTLDNGKIVSSKFGGLP
jgi:hypothetical protein